MTFIRIAAIELSKTVRKNREFYPQIDTDKHGSDQDRLRTISGQEGGLAPRRSAALPGCIWLNVDRMLREYRE